MNPKARIKERQALAAWRREGLELFREAQRTNGFQEKLWLLRRGIDEYGSADCFTMLEEMIQNSRQRLSTPRQLSRETISGIFQAADLGHGAAPACFFVGLALLYRGAFGILGEIHMNMNDEQLANAGQNYLQRAAAREHGYANFVLARRALDLWGERSMEALDYLERARQLGITDAFLTLSQLHKNRGKYLEAAIVLASGAQMGDAVCTGALLSLQRSRPRELVPYGKWCPALHFCCTAEMKSRIFTWLLVARRLRLQKDVQIRIIQFIVTAGFV